eukprot:scaffold359_cov313-Prasinococcus_capsulatus_cf.AAC.12
MVVPAAELEAKMCCTLWLNARHVTSLSAALGAPCRAARHHPAPSSEGTRPRTAAAAGKQLARKLAERARAGSGEPASRRARQSLGSVAP